ncbi:capsular polysaccharide export protein, LipB/KpsS family [Sphingomonas faeni]|uniref:capsular polysaccharide export protein, LipB/KpsS family n=1 Tax=Sphingomonas faeni TaxID=185950 RepID=UPI0020C02DA3|nr:beta-3-deoxy-D-manno-oct-2-ulosonic acid transferase [Sphingomonas faeni]MCK8457951.1 beta-3-deoxy-D-manno-oct-2-ulosonic acid transferase [Sphingomonas faeni]
MRAERGRVSSHGMTSGHGTSIVPLLRHGTSIVPLLRHGTSVLPLLRAPPFPSAAPVAITVTGGTPPSLAEARDALDALRAARVGGAFWDGERDPWTQVAQGAAVQANVDDDLAIVAWLSGVAVHDMAGTIVDPARVERACLDRLTAFACHDPFEDRPATLADTVLRLANWRRTLDANRGIGVMTGMALWKRAAIGNFLWDGRQSPVAASANKALVTARRSGRAIAGWASRIPADYARDAQAAGLELQIVEDGFIRSSGLGADGRVPSSITIDTRGIYYDPARPSDLETLLQTQVFSDDLIERARRLRTLICDHDIGKYGVAAGMVRPLPDRRCVLAIGQVEDDRSVLCGGAGVASNLQFLARVRACEPDAFIVYRPHPDVVAGHRKGHISSLAGAEWVDRIDQDSALLSLVGRVDAVHVLTSLTGFEALMRGRPVTVHGRPFFAGWGLTEDRVEQPARRRRTLTIDQLVAATLILYPRYIDPVTGVFCEVETLIARIAAGQGGSDTAFTLIRQALGRLRRQGVLIAAGVR